MKIVKDPNFYSVIIGTELLNGRRKDEHFSFLNGELLKRGYTQKASFVIIDNPKFIEDIFTLVKSDPNGVMFCFGGIGSTPDDYTREVAGTIFRDGKMEYNKEAKELIENQYGESAYPHRINMSYLPENSKLLKNVVNNVPGFYIDNRYFFTPGFPSMAHSMVLEALELYFVKNENTIYRKTLKAKTYEDRLIECMKRVSNEVELSSLPRMIGEKREVVISIASNSKKKTDENFLIFEEFLKRERIDYSYED